VADGHARTAQAAGSARPGLGRSADCPRPGAARTACRLVLRGAELRRRAENVVSWAATGRLDYVVEGRWRWRADGARPRTRRGRPPASGRVGPPGPDERGVERPPPGRVRVPRWPAASGSFRRAARKPG